MISSVDMEEILAAAIVRASLESRVHSVRFGIKMCRYEDPEDDIYWHTREACAKIARSRGIFFPNVITRLKGVGHFHPNQIIERSLLVWSAVAHPLLLVDSVLSE